MLNRRHLRIKVLQILYAFYQSEDKDILRARKELLSSVDKIYNLYLYYMLVFGNLLHFANLNLEDRRNKIRPTEEDLNPNLKFINNPVLIQLSENTNLKKLSEQRKVNWQSVVKQQLLKKLFDHLRGSSTYMEYMATTDSSFESNKEFVLDLFKTDIANYELLHDFFENESIYWIDDIDLVCSAVLKTIKKIEPSSTANQPIMELYKDKEDEVGFIKDLLTKTIENDEVNDQVISDLAKNWELERIAKMDIILLKMALTELTSLSSIPKKVTLNEYIEISKYYSTPKSQIFINGILDKAVVQLEKEGKLIKTGRGLID